jgi:NADH dehydrogenase
VRCASPGRELAYDYLVVASGAGPSYFGHDEWSRWAPGLKTIEDARDIRSQVLLTFERAERETDPIEQRRLCTIAIIGGGPTGVELAGSIAELSRHTLARDFRNITPQETKILLIEAGERVLGAFPQDLSAYARDRLDRLGVTVLTGRRVEEVGATSVTVSGESIPVGFVIWAAGVSASPLGRQLGVETDRAGRVPVSDTLEVQGLKNVFALGDIASQVDTEGKPLPGLAQVAKQQGIHLGQSLATHIAGHGPLQSFKYRSRGNTAIVGRHAAVYELGRFKMRGWIAWMAWAIIHVYLLVGFQHRFLVSMQWLWRYLTYERGARIIAGDFVEIADPKATPAPKTRVSA